MKIECDTPDDKVCVIVTKGGRYVALELESLEKLAWPSLGKRLAFALERAEREAEGAA